MGEKEKVLVQDKPGRLAQTARGFSISLALASGRVSVGGAQGGLAWVWTCMDSIGTIHRAMVLWPVGSTSLEPTLKRGDRVDVLIDSTELRNMFYTVSIYGITLYGVYGVYDDTVQNMKIEHSIVSSGTKNPLSRGDEEVGPG